MLSTLPHRRLWRAARLSPQEAGWIFASVREARRSAAGCAVLRGRHVALLGSAPGAAEDGFSRAVSAAGGRVALLDTGAWRSGCRADRADAARVLGSLYDAVDCCGLPADALEQIEQHANIPVFDGLARADHPLRLFSAVLAIIEWQAETQGPAARSLSVRVEGDSVGPLCQAACIAARSAGLIVQEGQADFVLDPAGPDGSARVSARGATALDRARIATLLAQSDRALVQAVIARALH